MARREALRDQSAQGNSGYTCPSTPVCVEECGKLLCQILNAIRPLRNTSGPMPRQIVSQQSESAFEWEGEIPEPMIDAQAVKQHERRAGASTMQRDASCVQ
jgi:hypothetical protein